MNASGQVEPSGPNPALVTPVRDDYSSGREQRARATELQDIAAMDRLAAEAAPASELRRYAASRRHRANARAVAGGTG